MQIQQKVFVSLVLGLASSQMAFAISAPLASCPKASVSVELETENGKEAGCESTAADGQTLRQGTWTSVTTKGKRLAENQYLDGLLHGTSISWFPTGGKRFETRFQKGIEEGLAQSWHENGTLFYSVHYVNGKPHGEWLYQYIDGGKKSENYVHGKPEGIWKEFDSKGTVVNEEIYKNGLLISTKAEKNDKLSSVKDIKKDFSLFLEK